MAIDHLHPAVRNWFTKQFAEPTEPQRRAWPSIAGGHHTSIAAPTGSGKTLAAFLSAINDLVERGVSGELKDETVVVYVSPLKALSNDIQRNLQHPLQGIQEQLHSLGLPQFQIRTWVRTGDTSAKDRASMRRQPPHIVVTTPESLYILLSSEGGRSMLRTTQTLIVDEIHAMADDKRGSHLALSMERLEALAGGRSAHRSVGHTTAYRGGRSLSGGWSALAATARRNAASLIAATVAAWTWPLRFQNLLSNQSCRWKFGRRSTSG